MRILYSSEASLAIQGALSYLQWWSWHKVTQTGPQETSTCVKLLIIITSPWA